MDALAGIALRADMSWRSPAGKGPPAKTDDREAAWAAALEDAALAVRAVPHMEPAVVKKILEFVVQECGLCGKVRDAATTKTAACCGKFCCETCAKAHCVKCCARAFRCHNCDANACPECTSHCVGCCEEKAIMCCYSCTALLCTSCAKRTQSGFHTVVLCSECDLDFRMRAPRLP